MAFFGGKMCGAAPFYPDTVKPVIRTICITTDTFLCCGCSTVHKSIGSHWTTASFLCSNSVQTQHLSVSIFHVKGHDPEWSQRVSGSKREGNWYFRQLLVALFLDTLRTVPAVSMDKNFPPLPCNIRKAALWGHLAHQSRWGWWLWYCEMRSDYTQSFGERIHHQKCPDATF